MIELAKFQTPGTIKPAESTCDYVQFADAASGAASAVPPPLLVSGEQYDRDSDEGYRFDIETKDRQTKLILENTLAEAHDAFRLATDLIMRRGDAASDTFLRHQLISTAREVAEVARVLQSNIGSGESKTPCFLRTLASEVSKLDRLFPGRVGQIDRRMTELDFVPSWTAEIVFGLIARTLIHDALIYAACKARVSVWLRQDERLVRLGVHQSGRYEQRTLVSRIDRPERFMLLREALRASVGITPSGITVCIPVIACLPTHPAEDEALFRPQANW
jgi:hypothetical protein